MTKKKEDMKPDGSFDFEENIDENNEKLFDKIYSTLGINVKK